MFAIFSSAIMSALGFLVRGVLVKFIVFTALFAVTTSFVAWLAPELPNATALTQALNGLDGQMWFFLDLFNVPVGISMIVSAYVTRFLIRRIPVIG
jgi:hypothetical protein